jgi:hypothetical protein
MNVNSLKRRLTKKLRQFFIITLIGGLVGSVAPVSTGATISIIDSLGAATPDTQFSVFGSSGGASILDFQFVGPKFTLTQTTTLTEIGGFVNCDIPQCATRPFTVQIRPSTNGVPDASTVLASFVLSNDNNPLVVSYESVAINLLLKPGTYFALFAPQGTDEGFLLGGASDPFVYQSGLIELGSLNPFTGDADVSQQFGAVRILGETNVVIDGCNSGVANVVVPGGSTIADLVAECSAGATNHGQFVSCVSHVTNDLKKTGTITGQQKSAIQKCAAQADIP